MEAVVAYYKALSEHSPAEAEEIHARSALSQPFCSPNSIQTCPEFEVDLPATTP
jgi:hypothetical protein